MARFEGVAVRGVRRVCYPVLIPAPNSCRRSPRVRRLSLLLEVPLQSRARPVFR